MNILEHFPDIGEPCVNGYSAIYTKGQKDWPDETRIYLIIGAKRVRPHGWEPDEGERVKSEFELAAWKRIAETGRDCPIIFRTDELDCVREIVHRLERVNLLCPFANATAHTEILDRLELFSRLSRDWPTSGAGTPIRSQPPTQPQQPTLL